MKGIAGKLTVCLAATTIAVLTILGVVEYHSGQLAIDRELQDSFAAISNRLKISLRQSVYEFDTRPAREMVLSEFPNPDVAAILVWTGEKQRLLCGLARNNGGLEDVLQVPYGNNLVSEKYNILVESRTSLRPEIIGEIQVFLDRSFPEHRLRLALFRDLSKITLTVILLLSILVFVINKFLVRPLEKIRLNMQETEKAALESTDADAWEVLSLSPSDKELSQGFSELRHMGNIFTRMVMAIRDREMDLRNKVEEMSALRKLNERITANLPLDKVIEAAFEGIVASIAPDMTMLFLKEGDELVLKGRHSNKLSINDDMVPVHSVGHCLCGLAVSKQQPIYSINIHTDSRCEYEECKKAGLTSLAALPLISGGIVLGVLGLASSAERNFAEQSGFLETISHEIAIGLQNSLLYEKIRESEEKFSKAFHSSPDAVLISQLKNGYIIDVNAGFEDITGFSRDESIGKTSFDLNIWVDPADRSKIEKILRDHGSFHELEVNIRRKQGDIRTCLLSIELINLRGEKHMITVGRDITESKKAETELRENKNRYYTLFESANDAIFLMKDDLFVECNRKTLEMFGCTRDQIINQPPYRFSPEMQPDGRESRNKALAKIEAAYNGNPQFFEWKHRQYDGTLFDAEVSLNSIELGSIRFLQAIVRDITERKRTEERLIEYQDHLEDLVKVRTEDLEMANEKLKELDKLKSMFIASMSHELRTPLNSIIGFTGIILQGMAGDINEEQRDQLQRVYGSAKHLLNLISDVIDISKVEAGKVEAYVEEFQLERIIEEAVSSLKTQIDDKKLGLEISESKGIYMKTDSRRLMQCILNISSNAVKFTEQGKITIATSENSGMIEIKVEDTGIGIAEKDIPRLFNSFVRLDSHIKTVTPGTGLGLYLTKKLAGEILGGSVSVESTYGEGSTFTLSIPKEIKTALK